MKKKNASTLKGVFLMVLAVGFLSVSQAEIIGHWPLDGDFNDLSGNGYNGTVSEDPLDFVEGKHGQAADFYGASIINCGDVPLGTNGQLTVAVWVKPRRIKQPFAGFVQKQNTDYSERSFWMGQHPKDGYFSWAQFTPPTAKGTPVLSSKAVLANDEWTHVAITMDGVYQRIYVNGKLDATSEKRDSGIVDGGDNLRFGRVENTKGGRYSGLMDDIWIFDEALSEEAIQKLMKGESLEKRSSRRVNVFGTVTDDSVQPIHGVTLVVKDTTLETETNADGNYFFAKIPGDATLQFSFAGMRTQEISVVDELATYDVILQEDTVDLEKMGLIGHWPLDGNFKDGSGNGYHGTISEQPLGFAQGKHGQAANFRGASYISCGDVPLGTNGQLTVAVWVKPYRIEQHFAGFIQKQNFDYSEKAFWMGQHPQDGYFCWAQFTPPDAPGTQLKSSKPVLVNQEWTHVAITHDGTYQRIYVNGTLETTSPKRSSGIMDGGDNLRFGRVEDGRGGRYSGLMDDVWIFGGALSENQIQKLMAGVSASELSPAGSADKK